MIEARKEEAAVAKSTAAEGVMEVIGGSGGEDTEEKREADTEVMKLWENVVAIVRAALGEKRLVEEDMWQAVVLIPKGKWD